MNSNPQEMAQAVSQFLRAAGLDPGDKDLIYTPRRVAELWCAEFLSGYQTDPDEIIGQAIEGEPETEMVLIAGLSFHSMCPHHLMPSQGKATVAYLPGERILGLGQIARLVACLTQRLTLQERATRQVAETLLKVPARGAACVMEARHMCLAVAGDRHDDSTIVTSAFVGELKSRPDLRARVLSARS